MKNSENGGRGCDYSIVTTLQQREKALYYYGTQGKQPDKGQPEHRKQNPDWGKSSHRSWC